MRGAVGKPGREQTFTMEGTLVPKRAGVGEGSRTGCFGEGHMPAGRETRILFFHPTKGSQLLSSSQGN